MEEQLDLDDIQNAINQAESEPEEPEDNSEEDEVQLTPAEVIQLMEEAWLNEKFAPEILPHKSEVVDCLLGQITYMEDNLKNLQSTDFKKSIHQLEVDRLRFLVTSYLRTRVEKIETFVTKILQEEQQRLDRSEELYLSKNELQFAKDYSSSVEKHLEGVLSFYPGLPNEERLKRPIVPNLHSFVFLKSKAVVDGVVIDDGGDEADGDLVDLNPGSQMIISYHSVANLVKKGDIHLI